MKAFALRLGAVMLLGSVYAQSALAQAPDEKLAALIRAAKSEGEVVAYSSHPNVVNQRFTQAFTAKYGVKISFLRLSSGPLVQRYASEASAGTVAADILFFPANGSEAFLGEAKKQGWLAPITAADIPALASGEYPKAFIRETAAYPSPVVAVFPWAFAYNTQKIAPKDVPKDWADLLNPKWKGQIIRTNPQLSLGQMDPWRMLLDRDGEAFFTKLKELNPRVNTPEAVASAQALAAGEGSITLMTNSSVIQSLVDRGAPVSTVIPEFTTGSEIAVYLSAKAKNPNAARLAIHFALTSEGAKIQSSDPGTVNVYDPSNLPKKYQSPKVDTHQFYARINQLLGN